MNLYDLLRKLELHGEVGEMHTLYSAGLVKLWDTEAGDAAYAHVDLTDHEDHFVVTFGPTVTCVHPQCDPQWQHGRNDESV